ncbi:MAG: hypothetical protein IJS00_05800 [Paludibacteraceae bacterium]|nr:hypothetical protein [Paludibacteraceae bacterium]
MKKLFFFLTLMLLCLDAAAWDLIITRESGKIECRVEEVSETHIKYRKASNPQGPLFTLEVKDVATVIYENGEVQAFEEQPEPQQNQYNNQQMTYEAYQLQRMQEREQLMKAREEAKEQRKQAKEEKKRLHDEKMSKKKVYFQGMFEYNCGVAFNKSGRAEYDIMPPGLGVAPGLDMHLGFRTQNLINYFGFGLGFHYVKQTIGFDSDFIFKRADTGGKVGSVKNFGMYYIPIYVNDRIYIPTKKNINPFFDLSAGFFFSGSGRIEYDDIDERNWRMVRKHIDYLPTFGVTSKVGIGMEYKRLVIGAGYQMIFGAAGSEIINFAYIKVGVRMGWLSPAKPIIKR